MLKKPDINPKYNVYTLMDTLSTAMHPDIDDEQWSKYFYIDGKELENIQDLFQRMNDWHVIDFAEGQTLDYLGNDFGVSRQGDDDEDYRFRIKSKKWIRKSDGTCNSMYRVVASCLELNPSDFYLHENGKINQFVIDDIPADSVPNGRRVKWLMEQAQPATAFGIKIADIVFTANYFETHNVFIGTQDETEVLNVTKQDNSATAISKLYSSSKTIDQTETVNVVQQDDNYYTDTFTYVNVNYTSQTELNNIAKLSYKAIAIGYYHYDIKNANFTEMMNISKNLKGSD